MMKHVTTPDGARLAVLDVGEGPAVLFVQGVGVAGGAWRPQLDALAGEFRCVAYDHRGVGRSDPPGGTVSVESMRDDAVAILDALGIDRVHLVGHSMGGAIVTAIALAAPSRVASLALLCTFSSGREAVTPTWPLIRHGLATQLGTARMRSRAMARMVSSPADRRGVGIPRLVAQLSSAFARPIGMPPAVARAQLRALAAYRPADAIRQLRAIPALVMAGHDDVIAPPRYGRRLAELLGAPFVELRDAGHAMTILQPVEVNAHLAGHLRNAETRP